MTAARRIGFAFNPTIEAAVDLRERAAGWCRVHGVAEWGTTAADLPGLVGELPTTDVLVVLGGDGTFLRAARAVAEVDVPILGINLGKIGFLSKVEAAGLEPILEELVAGTYGLEERMALDARILTSQRAAAGSPWLDAEQPAARPDPAGPAAGTRDRDGAERHVALNDVVVARGSLARVVRIDVGIDDTHLATFVADGLVVASPTGSTGYSFSSGGPIVDPTSRNLIVTPIAGYLSAIRSIVVSPRHVVRCRVVDAHEALVSIDGRDDVRIAVGDVVEVRAIERPIRLVEPSGSQPFWDLLRRKVELLPS